MQDFSCLFLKIVIFLSHLFSQQVKKINVSLADTLVGRNESDRSIFSGWFTGIDLEYPYFI